MRHNKERLPRTLWMLVDLDNKELPIMVCDSAKELAKECGVRASTVSTAVLRANTGKCRSRYVRVRIPEEERDDV